MQNVNTHIDLHLFFMFSKLSIALILQSSLIFDPLFYLGQN